MILFAQADQFVSFSNKEDAFTLVKPFVAAPILIDNNIDSGILKAIVNLSVDIDKVTGVSPILKVDKVSAEETVLLIGTIGKSKYIDDLVKNKKINAEQARKNFTAIGDTYGDVAANIKKISVPQWLSSDDKAKLEDLKKQYVEACDAMKAFVPIYSKIMVDDKGTKEDVEKLKEYNAIKNDRTKKGAALFAHFEKGTWK